MREEESPTGVMRICFCVLKFVMYSMVSNPVVNTVLQVKFVKIVAIFGMFQKLPFQH